MQTVTFAADYDHYTPLATTSFKAGATEKVTDAIADAARDAGKLKEKADGGRSDQGSAKGDAPKA